MVHKFLPKQCYLKKVIKLTEKKLLKGTHLTMTVNEIQAGYLTSSYFKKHIHI